jgi:hypothetical protein
LRRTGWPAGGLPHRSGYLRSSPPRPQPPPPCCAWSPSPVGGGLHKSPLFPPPNPLPRPNFAPEHPETRRRLAPARKLPPPREETDHGRPRARPGALAFGAGPGRDRRGLLQRRARTPTRRLSPGVGRGLGSGAAGLSGRRYGGGRLRPLRPQGQHPAGPRGLRGMAPPGHAPRRPRPGGPGLRRGRRPARLSGHGPRRPDPHEPRPEGRPRRGGRLVDAPA